MFIPDSLVLFGNTFTYQWSNFKVIMHNLLKWLTYTCIIIALPSFKTCPVINHRLFYYLGSGMCSDNYLEYTGHKL